MLQKKNRSNHALKLGLVILVMGASVGMFVRYFASGVAKNTARYRTVPVIRQNISMKINATGTLEPCDIIDVGAQVAGRIIEFGIDPNTGKHVDYGSYVTKGMVLARIDPSLYELEVAIAEAQAKRAAAHLTQSIAQLQEANASIRRSEAELAQQKSKLHRSESEWSRSQSLVKTSSVSIAEVETARTDYDSLKAAVMVAEAAVEQSKSRLASQKAAILATEAEAENSEAVLKRTKTTLNYCTIVSPIDGVIIDRRVNQGQTVVASLSTPSLFLLASDLRQLEIWVSVNEADIGQIQPKMPVRFSVDSHPDEIFHGSVKQIRLNASMSQNVVTYTVVVSVLNDSSHLLPYLTANVEFIINEQKDALCIPNSALRFEPENKTKIETNHSQSKVIWTVANDQLQPVAVTTGITDGSVTQIVSEELIEETPVVVGWMTVDATAQPANPFVPRMKSNKRDNKP